MTILSEPRADDPLQVQHATLDNGLTVLLSPNREQPRVYCRVVVKAGAAQEPRATTGLAHYLEHMLANKGTHTLGTVDYAAEAPGLTRIEELYRELAGAEEPAARAALSAAIAEQSGAIARFAIPNELKQLHGRLGSRGLNAFTSHDQTSYVVDVASGRLPAWAVVESDRLASPVFRSFQTEVETICEEKKRSLDDPSKQAHRALMDALWGEHPYGEAVLGRSEHLESPSIAAMRAFHARWYVPENMAVVLAGDLDPEETLALVQRHFGALPSAPPGPSATPIPSLVGERRIPFTHRGQPELRLAWRTPAADHPDTVTLELLDEVLHNDGTGLFDRLVQAQELRAAGSFCAPRLQRSAFCVWARPRAGQSLAELEEMVLDQVQRLQDGAFDPEMLAGIVRNLEVEELAGRESNQHRAKHMADGWLRGLDPHDAGRRLEALRALGAPDVTRAAQRYLGADRAVLWRTDGEPESRAPVTFPLPPLPPSAKGHSKRFLAALAAPAQDAEPRTLRAGADYERREFPGVSVIAAPNPHNDLVRVTLSWRTGWEEHPGLDAAVRLARKSGTADRSRADLASRLFRLAATVEMRPGRWSTSIALAGPRDTSLPAAQEALHRLLRPVLPPHEGHADIDDLLLRREQARSSRSHHIQALSAYAGRGAQSAYLLRWDEEALRRLVERGPASVTGALAQWPVRALVTGPADVAGFAEILGAASTTPAEPPPLTYVEPLADRILLLDHPSEQAHVSVHSPQPGYTASDYGVRRLWSEILGGPAGLVFQEVREKRGMAYSAQAGLSTGWRTGDSNLAWLAAGTEARKAADVAGLLVSLLRTFPASPGRLARARQSAIASRVSSRIGFKSVPGTVQDWANKGIDQDPLPMHLEALAQCSDQAVRDYATAVGERPVTISIVGDVSRLDRDALAAIAPITELTLDDVVR